MWGEANVCGPSNSAPCLTSWSVGPWTASSGRARRFRYLRETAIQSALMPLRGCGGSRTMKRGIRRLESERKMSLLASLM